MTKSSLTYPLWSEPSPHLRLDQNEVHIWRQTLDISTRVAARLRTLLSTDEISRADSFHYEVDRNRFTVARSSLRIILGRYLRTDPAKIRFTYSEYGKPSILSPSNASEICFNLAHSDRLAVYAVTRNRNIGVDLEMVRPEFAGTEIADRFFSSNEAAHVRSFPISEQQRAFFTCWTRKEALLKAKGVGLSEPLNQVEVMGDLDESAEFVKSWGAPKYFAGWSIRTIDLSADFVAAVAVKGNNCKLSYWQRREDHELDQSPREG